MVTHEISRSDLPCTELLRGFEDKEIDVILKAAKARLFPERTVITHQGDIAEQLLLLCRGRARFFFNTPDGRKLVLIWLTPGRIFGAAAFAPKSIYLVSSEATRDSIVLAWDGPILRELARQFPRLMMNAYFTCMDYLGWYVGTHAALSSDTARERLANILVGYAPSIGHKVPDGIEIDVTEEELANAANITRYTASRIISEWQRKGAIHKKRGKILLLSDKKLF